MFEKISRKSQAALAQLNVIEAEMKRIGYWSATPPDLQADIKTGKLRSYLDAPSFEVWLQCVFLPNARAAAEKNAFPKQSQVGIMALRQYDYHSQNKEAETLLQLLAEFDALVEGRSE